MVSVPRQALAQPTAGDAPVAGERAARLNARVSAYLIDSAVLFAFILAFLTLAGSILLFSSDSGRRDAPDSAYYAFIAVLIGGSIISWSLFNIALDVWRGQSVGKYLVGIRVTGDRERSGTLSRAIVRWFGLSPLCFHPMLMPLWGLFGFFTTVLTLSQAVMVVMLAVLFLWVLSPILALITVLADPDRRGLHDRLAGTIVVPAGDRGR
jgi:uncharacterized RDD family membrane protein YckC